MLPPPQCPYLTACTSPISPLRTADRTTLADTAEQLHWKVLQYGSLRYDQSIASSSSSSAAELTPSLPTALFFYDAAITFDREVACYWASKQTGAAFLFLANKWISMTLYVMTLISFASFPTDQVSRLLLCHWQRLTKIRGEKVLLQP